MKSNFKKVMIAFNDKNRISQVDINWQVEKQ